MKKWVALQPANSRLAAGILAVLDLGRQDGGWAGETEFHEFHEFTWLDFRVALRYDA